MFNLYLSREATSYLKRVDVGIKYKIYSALEGLKADPFSSGDIKKLTGRLKGKFRLRIGNLRIIYRINLSPKEIRIEAIKSRGDVYKRK